nr:MAG TPA: hypothetical protein [Caudoviricetes sp.]
MRGAAAPSDRPGGLRRHIPRSSSPARSGRFGTSPH